MDFRVWVCMAKKRRKYEREIGEEEEEEERKKKDNLDFKIVTRILFV